VEHLDLRDTGLRFAEAGVTPGFELIHAIDLDAGRVLKNAYKVDLDAKTVWEFLLTGGRAHPRQGRFVVVATGDVIQEYQERWKSSK
jgi:hypothetical protein